MTDDFYYPSLVAIVAVPFYTLFITTIRGLSYTRNGFIYSYPFLESIQSIVGVYDEFVIDGTREAIEALKNPKIRIINTVWDEQMRIRIGGKIFAQQTNVALNACMGDWLFHIQADEVITRMVCPPFSELFNKLILTLHRRALV